MPATPAIARMGPNENRVFPKRTKSEANNRTTHSAFVSARQRSKSGGSRWELSIAITRPKTWAPWRVATLCVGRAASVG